MSPFEKLKRLVAELGRADALLYCLDRLGQATGGRIGFTRYLLVAQPVVSLAISGLGSTITVRPLESLAGLSNETTLTAKSLAARTARNTICFGAFVGDKLVGFACISLVPHDDEILNIRFITAPANKTAWDYDLFIAPGHRLGVVYAKLWNEMFAFLKSRGIEWTISHIASYNLHSWRSHSRMGAVPIGSLIVIRLGRRHIVIDCARRRVLLADESPRRAEVLISAPASGVVFGFELRHVAKIESMRTSKPQH